MDPLRSALAALAATLESDHTLAQTVAHIEREFAIALGADRVTIVLGTAARLTAPAAHEVAFPLVLDGRSAGTATFAFLEAPAEAETECARAVVAPLAAALAWRSHATERDRLFELVRTDALTGLANRMSFDERLDSVWRSAGSRGTTLTLALLDIDYFKIFNDMHGHVGGDECLRSVAALLATEARRENGFVARYGGEEFALIAEGLDSARAVASVARILGAFEERPIAHDGSTLGRVSMSAGVATGMPPEWAAIADFVREADRSLYRAKALGRNRICAGTYASTGPVASRSTRSIAGPPAFDDATVGREADLTRLIAALRQARMISLVGPSGVGKSRLACLAGVAAEQFVTDGVAYVDFSLLAADSDPIGALASSLDVAHESNDAREGLRNAVRERNMLIVLDNVAEAAARRIAHLCDDLLGAAPALSILATSRAALGCVEERTFVVAPLAAESAVELLRVRSGSTENTALRSIARALGGDPKALEDMGRLLAAQRSEAPDFDADPGDDGASGASTEKRRRFFYRLDGRDSIEAPTL
jgi:diguanylate cyclase (GGDEF)-like protein